MSDEQINVEAKECNCPVCRVLKSDCTKKFLAVVLASFIGCSLALLIFAPKKPPRHDYKQPPIEYHIYKPLPPMMHGNMIPRQDFRGDRRFDGQRCHKHHKNMHGVRPSQRPEKKDIPNFKRPIEEPKAVME